MSDKDVRHASSCMVMVIGALRFSVPSLCTRVYAVACPFAAEGTTVYAPSHVAISDGDKCVNAVASESLSCQVVWPHSYEFTTLSLHSLLIVHY